MTDAPLDHVPFSPGRAIVNGVEVTDVTDGALTLDEAQLQRVLQVVRRDREEFRLYMVEAAERWARSCAQVLAGVAEAMRRADDHLDPKDGTR